MPYFGIPIRNGLPIGLGSVAGFGISPFDPSSLFAAGEQGAWYDPSDYSTLFTDSAGTTPVSAPGNGSDVFVGLMLDKSQGLVLGPELTTGILNSSANWTLDAAGSVTGGALVINTPVITASIQIYVPPVAGTFVVGKFYRITFNVTRTQGTITVAIGSAPPYNSGNITASGTYSLILPCAGGTPNRISFTSGASAVNNFIGSIDNISIRELPGNHAFQTSSAKRPKLAARYNLLTYSEEFDQGVWTKGNATITANAATAPDGTTTADAIKDVLSAGQPVVLQAVNIPGGVVYSCYVKQVPGSQATWCNLRIVDGGNARSAFVNLTTGAVGVVGSGSVVTADLVGNGWVRITHSRATPISLTAYSCRISPATADGVDAWTGTGDDVIYIWGADLRPASQATGLIGPTYQRVAAATVYDTAGFLPYLAFDGLDDSMSTNSIDFSAGDKVTLWAGVRKLSDAADGIVAELSANAANTAGGFNFGAPSTLGSSVNYGCLARTTARGGVGSNGYSAPITNVISCAFDNGQALLSDEIKPRINGVLDQDVFLDGPIPSGNFGNYPLFIGMRNNASAPFNGWLTSLIVRGAQSTQSQIEATEAWVNGKTGAY